MKTNFKTSKKTNDLKKISEKGKKQEKKDLTQAEFEDFIVKAGAAGSFMIFRSDKKKDEMGLDEL